MGASIRLSISAEDWNRMDVFVDDLKSVPIPKRLIELFYMLNANYRFEDLPKSPIIKITSGLIYDDKTLGFNIPYLIKQLNDSKFRDICNKIIRTIPNWYNNDFPMYGPETYYSKNFNTIFANSGV